MQHTIGSRVGVARQHRVPTLVSVVVHAALLGYCAWVSVTPENAGRELIRITLLPGGKGGGSPAAAPPQGEPLGPPAPPPARISSSERKTVTKPKAARARPAGVKPRAEIAPPAPAVNHTGPSGEPDTSAGVSNGGSAAGAGDQSAASGTGAGGGRGAGGSDVVQRYLLMVRQRIEQAKRYPVRARRAGVEGLAAVSFDLTLAGRPERIHVRSADHPWLGDAAVRAIHDAAPFPRLPAEIDQDRLHLEVPLRFSLREENQWKN